MADVRWMLFVDGENLARRGQDFLSESAIEITAGRFWRRDVFLWNPEGSIANRISNKFHYFEQELIRAHYYTSTVGGESERAKVAGALRAIGFDAAVFHRPAERSGRASKGVDIALTTDMLSHAYLSNYGTAVLVAGDADYVPLVDAVKRQGKRVFGLFVPNGASPELKLACDRFDDLGEVLAEFWRRPRGVPLE